MNMWNLIMTLITGEELSIKHLRLLVKLGYQGVSHQYRDHVSVHYKDHTHMNKYEFYLFKDSNIKPGRYTI